MPKPKRNHKRKYAHIRLFARRLSDSAVRRLCVVALTTLTVFLLLLWRLQPERVSLHMDDVANQTITANRAAVYVDSQETERLRQEASSSISPVYNRVPDAIATAERTIVDVFATAATVRENPDLTSDLDRVDQLRDILDVQLSPQTLRLLVEMQPGAVDRVKSGALQIVREQMDGQIRSNTDDLVKARERAEEMAGTLVVTAQFRRMVAELSQAALRPTMIYDPQATQEKRDQAAKQVEDVRRQLQPGDLIISPGDTVTARHLAMFEALGLIQPTIDYSQAAALLLLIVAITLAVSVYILHLAAQAYRDERLLYTLCVAVVLAVLVIRFAEGSQHYTTWTLSAVTTVAMLISLVISSEVAVAAVIYLSVLVGSMAAGGDPRLMISSLVAGIAAAHVIPMGRARTTMISRAGALTALVNPLALGIASKMLGMDIPYRQLGATAGGGLASAMLAFGIVMVIQRPLRLTTEMRLMELLNPNEPLLKRLLTEAPGSYQSSAMVANLAEPAAEAIGANSLLTRVCCMYHDVGKLKRPHFFAENLFGSRSPHDNLSPHLSTLVLTSHVRDGVELAKEAGLPAEVAAVIPEHHGTTLVSYLYRKAVAEADDPSTIQESDFRYSGPRPQSKETALVMLADTVEAAARTMEEPHPQRVEELVERLIDAKIEDNQLDEAPLTFADIATIKHSFKETLNRMFHQRVRYPDRFLPENIRGLTGPRQVETSSGKEGEQTSAS
jgi:putative nucleotidyltransferase with HDIG domain